MYIYNITTNIEEASEREWLQWMQDVFIPEMLATGKFSEAKMTKVLVKEDMGGVTYSVQYTTDSLATLQSFYNEEATALKNKVLSKFAGKYVFFETEMQLISKQFSGQN